MRAAFGVDSQLITRCGLALALFVAIAIFEPAFASVGNVYTVFEGFAFIGLVGLGVGITMLAGEFDLSVGSLAAVAGIVAVSLAGIGLVPSVLAAVAMALVVGLVQGLAIALLRINSLVFTIGSLIALRGVAFVISNEKTVTAIDLTLAEAIQKQILIFSPFSLITIAIFVLAGIFLGYTRYGREILAIGGGRNEALAAGVPFVRPIVVAFAISGTLAGLTGALVSLKSGSATPFGLDGLLLPAVTAALIGGVSLQGGKGSVIGIAVGVLTLRFITSVLSLQGQQFYVESLAIGALLLIVLVIELLAETPEARSRWRQRGLRRPPAPAG